MTLDHRIKAVYWWRYMHTEHPLPPDLILERMPTDDEINVLRAVYGQKARGREPVEWDAGLTWSELHHSKHAKAIEIAWGVNFYSPLLT